jgi:S-adenosylmethionine hydrolase
LYDDINLDDYLKGILEYEMGEKAMTYEIIEKEMTSEEVEEGRVKFKIEFTAIDSFGDAVAGIEFEDEEEFEVDEEEVADVNFGEVSDDGEAELLNVDILDLSEFE